MDNKRIYITGFMGAGKSAVGKRLADKLRFNFFDLDKLIEQKFGMAVTLLFEEYGEDHFRKLERECLQMLANENKDFICALGGGALMNGDCLNIIKNSGILVYLNVKESILISRLKNKTKRPLLLNSDGTVKSEEELKTLINSMLAQRKPIYGQADLSILIKEERPLEIVASLVHNKVTRYLDR